LVWHGHLPRPLQQLLVDTAGGVTLPASSPPTTARPTQQDPAEPASVRAAALVGC
jgi:hypothetical protein